MKRSLKFSGLTAACCLLAPVSMAADLTVNIKTGEPPTSSARIALYDDPTQFPDGKPIRKLSLEPGSDTLTASIANLEPGTYAIAAYIDSNKDSQLDKNFLGIPEEPYGFSGERIFGPPSFEKAKFDFGDDDQAIIVESGYPVKPTKYKMLCTRY